MSSVRHNERTKDVKASTCYRLPEPKDPRTGRRRPHVPSSKTNNVKDPRSTPDFLCRKLRQPSPPNSKTGQPAIPRFLGGGLALSVMSATRQWNHQVASSRPVKRHICRASESVKHYLQKSFIKARNGAPWPVSGPSHAIVKADPWYMHFTDQVRHRIL